MIGEVESLPDADVKSTDPMAIVYTGGSKSMPKGVLVSHLYYIGTSIRYAEIAQETKTLKLMYKLWKGRKHPIL